MTLSELYKATAALGFEGSLEDDEIFRAAANRAILEVNAICPRLGTYVLHHDPPVNALAKVGYAPIGKETELYFASSGVKAYSFECDGNGIAAIEAFDGVEWQTIKEIELSSDGVFRHYGGTIKKDGAFFLGDVRLHFMGDYYYAVRFIALFKTVRSGRDEDVPHYGPMVRYDFGTLAEGFMALCKPPIMDDSERRAADGYEVEERRYLLMPWEARGAYRIRYERYPESISEEEDMEDSDTELSIPDEIASILPLLVAAYVWADDEEDKAEKYHMIYRERAAALQKKYREMTPFRVHSTKGW